MIRLGSGATVSDVEESTGCPSTATKKGYAFVEIEILNRAEYVADYVPRALAAVQLYGGRFLHTGRNVVAKAGDLDRRRVILIEFPSFDRATAFYESPEYQDAISYRDMHAIVHRYYLLPAD